MNDRADTMLAFWLAEGPERGPQEGLARALAATRRTRQRPAWAFPQSWLLHTPMPGAMPRTATVALLLVAALLVATTVAALTIGSRPHLPAPFGPAGNGRVGFDTSGTIYLAEADGSDVRPFDAGEGYDQTLTFSPDGTRFAYWSSPGPDATRYSLWVTNVDGSGARKVSGDLPIVLNPSVNPSWSPDGSMLLIHSTIGTARSVFPNGQTWIYAVNADGSGQPRQIGDPAYDYWQPRWSPDQQWIAFNRSDGATDSMVIVHPDGSGAQVFARQGVADVRDCPYDEEGASWSPDSTRFAFPRRVGAECVVTVATVGGTAVDVYRAATRVWGPTFSPEGTMLAFGVRGRGLVIARPNGSVIKAFDEEVAGCPVLWAPDGQTILAMTADCTVPMRFDVTGTDPPRPVGLPSSARALDWQRIAP